MKNKLTKALVILGLFFPAVISADTVTLKSGKKLEGKILEKTNQYIKIDIDGNALYYELKYIQSIEEEPSAKDAKFYLKKGLDYASCAKFQEAGREFRRGIEIDPSNHNLQETLKMIDNLKNGRITPEYALYLFKGSNYLINAKYQEAVTEFKEALRLKPDDADLNYYLGVSNYSLGLYTEAIKYLEKALNTKQDDELYYFLGVSNYSLGQYQEAIKYLKKVLEINPIDAEAYMLIGMSRYLSGEPQLAKEDFSKAKELFLNLGDYLKAKEVEDFLGRIN